jgi:prophage antirepressor-like protein
MKTQNSLERIFHYQDRAVRTVMMEGEPWFVAKDICAALGIVNSRAALDGLEEDEKARVGISDTSSSSRRTITVLIVSEPGLYSLVLKSRRPEAREFRRWITHEVIPVLRRTGYQLGDDFSTAGKLLPFSRRDLLQLAAEAESECEALRQENAALRPKAEFYERVADTSACFSLGETAKMLEVPGFGRNNLIRFLRAEGILMTNNVAKQKFINRGYFHIVQTDFFAADGTLRVKAVTRVYEKGVDYIRRILDRYLMRYVI